MKYFKRFKELRLEKMLTQAELAKKLGVTVGCLRGVELGKVKCKVGYLIAYASFLMFLRIIFLGVPVLKSRIGNYRKTGKIFLAVDNFLCYTVFVCVA